MSTSRCEIGVSSWWRRGPRVVDFPSTSARNPVVPNPVCFLLNICPNVVCGMILLVSLTVVNRVLPPTVLRNQMPCLACRTCSQPSARSNSMSFWPEICILGKNRLSLWRYRKRLSLIERGGMSLSALQRQSNAH